MRRGLIADLAALACVVVCRLATAAVVDVSFHVLGCCEGSKKRARSDLRSTVDSACHNGTAKALRRGSRLPE